MKKNLLIIILALFMFAPCATLAQDGEGKAVAGAKIQQPQKVQKAQTNQTIQKNQTPENPALDATYANNTQEGEGEYLSPEIKKSLSSDNHKPDFIHALFSLIIVIGLIYLTGFIYQKLVKFNAKFVKKEGDKENPLEIKVVNCIGLGQNKYLHTIEHNNKYLLIASTPQNITLLKEYSKEDEN